LDILKILAVLNSTKQVIETSTNESASEGEIHSGIADLKGYNMTLAKTYTSFTTECRIKKQEPLSSKSQRKIQNSELK
jgi:hypothetical protein